MTKRRAKAVWKGSGKEGTGQITTQSSALNNAAYSTKARFEEAKGTNPEELIAAAHSGCYSMKLAFILNEAGFTAEEISTECVVTFDDGWIGKSELTVKAKVPGIPNDKFLQCAEEAKVNCPISKSLKADISLVATLV